MNFRNFSIFAALITLGVAATAQIYRWELVSYANKGDPKKKVESSWPNEDECKEARKDYNAVHSDRWSTCNRVKI